MVSVPSDPSLQQAVEPPKRRTKPVLVERPAPIQRAKTKVPLAQQVDPLVRRSQAIRKTGPKTSLTAEIADTLVQSMRLGTAAATAARLVGIRPEMLYDWLKRGEVVAARLDRGEPIAPEDMYMAVFAVNFHGAVADAEVTALREIRAGVENWQSRAWFLERRFSQQWGRRQAVQVSGPDGKPIQMQQMPAMTSEQLMAIAGGKALVLDVVGSTVDEDESEP